MIGQDDGCRQSLGIVEMLREFGKLMSQKKYKEAYALAVKICSINPDNEAAQIAVTMARAAVTQIEVTDLCPESFVPVASRHCHGNAMKHCDQDDAEACEPAVANAMVEQAIRIMRLAMCPLSFSTPEEITEMPEEEPSDESMPEQTEEPVCSEHRHEGCPYMGGACPCPRGAPEQSPVQIPAGDNRPPKCRKHHKPECSNSWDQLINNTSERRSFNVPFTDTMEFRPSDAGRYPVLKAGPF
jgi:hypothetical protein